MAIPIPGNTAKCNNHGVVERLQRGTNTHGNTFTRKMQNVLATCNTSTDWSVLWMDLLFTNQVSEN